MASEKDSGFENAERSASSDHGRRWSRPCRRDAERLLMKARKAGLFAGASMAPPPAAVVWGLDMGRTGAAVEDMIVLERESQKGRDSCGLRERETPRRFSRGEICI